jgi:prolyl-tRNA synthetase
MRSTVERLLDEIQRTLFERADAFRKENTRCATDYKQFQNLIETKRGFLEADWCGNAACEDKIKEDTKATIRCIPFDLSPSSNATCISCGSKAAHRVYFARAY